MIGLFLVFIVLSPFCLGRAVFLAMDGAYLQSGIAFFFGVILAVWAYQCAPGQED